jgi:hypothetical protein
MSSYIGIIRTLIASTKTKDIIRFFKTVDKKQRIRGAMEALQVTHILIALSSVFMETAIPFVQHLHTVLFPGHAKVKKLYDMLDSAMKEFGPGLITAAMTTKKEHIKDFFGNDSDDEETMTKQQRIAKQQKKAEQEAEEWLTLPDPEGDALLTAEELEAKKEKLALRDAKLQNRLEIFSEFTKAFYDLFKDPEINRMLKAYDEELFLNPENWIKISYLNSETQEMTSILDPENFEDGMQQDAAEAYAHIITMDDINQEVHDETIKKAEEEQQDVSKIAKFEPYQTKFWKTLNNLELLSKTLHEVTKDNLEQLLQFVRKLYDDFMNHKIDDVRKLPVMIIDEIKRTTQFDAKSASTIGDFVLEAVFHNVSAFREAFDAIKKMIPPELYELAKEYGYDVKNMDVDGIVNTNLSKLLNIRNTRNEKGKGSNEADYVSPFFEYFQNKAQTLEAAAASSAEKNS